MSKGDQLPWWRITAAVFTLAVSSSCAPTVRCGDARTVRNDGGLATIFGLTPPGYDAHLPPVALSRAGNTEFHLVGLPPGHYRYEFSLTGGSIYGDRRNDPVHPPPWASHANTEISFRATAPNGTTLYNADFRLKDLEWYPYVWSMHPEIHSGLPVIAAADFTLTVTVRHPSTAPREKLIISGFAEDARPIASPARR